MGIGPEPGIVLKPKDSRGGSGPVSALGCRAYVCLDGAVSSSVKGLREEPGEFPGLVAIGGMSFPDAPNGP